MRHFVVGDIHGNYDKLLALLEHINFRPEEDCLIGVGDYVDGHSKSYEVIDHLSKLPNFKGVIGNHDAWFRDWLNSNNPDKPQYSWYSQGGRETIKSYQDTLNIPLDPLCSYFYTPGFTEELVKETIKNNLKKVDAHKDFLNSLPFKLELTVNSKKILIVHGGVPPQTKLEDLNELDVTWNRDLYYDSKLYNLIEMDREYPILKDFDLVVIGHTAHTRPVKIYGKVVNIDTNAGYTGQLSCIELETFKTYSI